MARKPSPPPECANCGAEIPPNATACPECGADERTGWREVAATDGLDLPDDAFEDAPSPGDPAHRRRHLPWYWLAAGLLLVVWLVLGAFALR